MCVSVCVCGENWETFATELACLGRDGGVNLFSVHAQSSMKVFGGSRDRRYKLEIRNGPGEWCLLQHGIAGGMLFGDILSCSRDFYVTIVR